MELLKALLELISEKEIDDKNEVDTSNQLTSKENFDKFMKGQSDIEIPIWLKGIGETKEDKSVEENKEKTEEEKYLEEVFGVQKNDFVPANNKDQINKNPEEKLNEYLWLNFYGENYYLDDNIGIEKNIKTEIYLTDEEIKNGVTKIIKYERTELISKYNYINGTETMETQTVEYQKEIVIPPNVEEGTVYKFIGFGNCFEDIDEKIECGDLYIFILGGTENENL